MRPRLAIEAGRAALSRKTRLSPLPQAIDAGHRPRPALAIYGHRAEAATSQNRPKAPELRANVLAFDFWFGQQGCAGALPQLAVVASGLLGAQQCGSRSGRSASKSCSAAMYLDDDSWCVLISAWPLIWRRCGRRRPGVFVSRRAARPNRTAGRVRLAFLISSGSVEGGI